MRGRVFLVVDRILRLHQQVVVSLVVGLRDLRQHRQEDFLDNQMQPLQPLQVVQLVAYLVVVVLPTLALRLERRVVYSVDPILLRRAQIQAEVYLVEDLRLQHRPVSLVVALLPNPLQRHPQIRLPSSVAQVPSHYQSQVTQASSLPVPAVSALVIFMYLADVF